MCIIINYKRALPSRYRPPFARGEILNKTKKIRGEDGFKMPNKLYYLMAPPADTV